MMLTDLGDAARSSGLQVIEEPGWQTRGHGPMSGVRSIVCHHTAGPPTGDLPSLRTVRDGRPDLAGPLAQLMLSRSGAVHVVAAGLCWHAGAVFDPSSESNEWAIGIEAEHDGVSPWPPAQYQAYVRLAAALAAWYRLGPRQVLGHKEVARPLGRKSDPNFDCDQFRRDVATVLAPDLQEDDVSWTQPTVPDLYPGAPQGATLPSPLVALAWAVAHAATARDAARDAVRAVDGLRADLAAGHLTAVDLDVLAAKVADVLAARLGA